MDNNAAVFPALDPNIYPAIDPSASSSSSSQRPAPPRAWSANSLPLLSDSVSNLTNLADVEHLEHLPRTAVDHLPGPRHTHPCCPPPPVYVLAADGSHLYLLDSRKLPSAESPPPYAPFRSSRARATTFAGQVARPPRPSPPISPPSSSRPAYDTVDEVPAATRLGGTLRSIVCGDRPVALALDEEDLEAARVPSAWSQFWAPVGDGETWHALLHLIGINLPFNLLVWPPLLVGTLAGTVLLITLPIGAVVWWLTLIIARWAAREELRLQSRFHGIDTVHHRPRPIFHRLRERPSLQPHSPYLRSTREGGEETEIELVRDTRFLNNSWTMFSDHYSYAALAYFLLIKPVTILLPTILFVAFLPVCVVLFPLLPIYLRAARVFGHAQAGVAVDNL